MVTGKKRLRVAISAEEVPRSFPAGIPIGNLGGLRHLELDTLYLEYNPCYDQSKPGGGEFYVNTLLTAAKTLSQLDNKTFEGKDENYTSLYGAKALLVATA